MVRKPLTRRMAEPADGCGTINLSSDDALDVLQISCRSRARSRQGFSRGWAEAHPHPGPYRVDTSCGSHRWRDFFSLSALQGQGNRIWRDCCLSLLCHSRGSGNPAPQNRYSPLDSRLRGNDGNREVGEPKCDCPAFGGAFHGADGAGGISSGHRRVSSKPSTAPCRQPITLPGSSFPATYP